VDNQKQVNKTTKIYIVIITIIMISIEIYVYNNFQKYMLIAFLIYMIGMIIFFLNIFVKRFKKQIKKKLTKNNLVAVTLAIIVVTITAMPSQNNSYTECGVGSVYTKHYYNYYNSHERELTSEGCDLTTTGFFKLLAIFSITFYISLFFIERREEIKKGSDKENNNIDEGTQVKASKRIPEIEDKTNKEIAIEKFKKVGLTFDEADYLAQDVAELSLYADNNLFNEAEDNVHSFEEAYKDKYFMSTVDTIIDDSLPIKDIASTGIQARAMGLNFEIRTAIKKSVFEYLEKNKLDNTHFREVFIQTLSTVNKEDGKENYSNKTKVSETESVDIQVEYYENGSIHYEIPFINGQKNGLEKEYYESGNLKYETLFINGKLDGIRKGYFAGGGLEYEVVYVNGMKYGVEKEYYANTNLVYEIPFVNDKKDGIQKEYFDSGRLKLEIPYVVDKRDGIQKEYYENGNLKLEVPFVNNKADGLEKGYYETGELRYKKLHTYEEETIYEDSDDELESLIKAVEEERDIFNKDIISLEATIEDFNNTLPIVINDRITLTQTFGNDEMVWLMFQVVERKTQEEDELAIEFLLEIMKDNDYVKQLNNRNIKVGIQILTYNNQNVAASSINFDEDEIPF